VCVCVGVLPPCCETTAPQSDRGCSSELLVFDTGSATPVAPNFALQDDSEEEKMGKKHISWGMRGK